MKKLNITWESVHDSTGYLFSLAKSLSCAVKNSPWAEYAEDIIATSGFSKYSAGLGYDLTVMGIKIKTLTVSNPV